MELFNLEEIALDEITLQLLGDVRQTAREVNELRPLPPKTVERVQRDLLGERVYSSNAIEGNTLELRETRVILEAGHIRGSEKKREATEAINLGKAIEYTQDLLLKREAAYTAKQFLTLHRILLTGIDDDTRGRFRDRGVMITGAKHQPPDQSYVPGLVERFFDRLRTAQDIDPVLLATWAHWTIARIHPFHDGNGRMARLWQDLILFKSNFTCAIIGPEHRTEYLANLQEADDGDFNPLTRLVAQRVASTLDKYIAAQQESEELTTWATELVGEVDARAAEQRKLEYMRWSRKMEELRYAFRLCASKITQTSSTIDIQVRTYDIIEQSKWENLQSGLGAALPSYFIVSFRRPGRSLQYVFFFATHVASDVETDPAGPRTRTCLSISEQEDREAARLLDEIEDTPLSLRQLFVVDGKLVRQRCDSLKNNDDYDNEIDAGVVARDFIQDVLLKRIG